MLTSVNFNLAAPLSVDRPEKSEKQKKSHSDQESPNIHVKTCVPFIAVVKAQFHKKDQLISKETYKLWVLRNPPDVDETDEEFQTVGCKKTMEKSTTFSNESRGKLWLQRLAVMFLQDIRCSRLEASGQIKESKVTRAADFEILLENIFILSPMQCSHIHILR